jgi:hypothetical protein
MVLFRVIVGTIWVSILLIGPEIWTPREPVTPRIRVDVEPGTTLSGAHMDEGIPYGTGVPPRIDLYGNPVETAVGDYRTDPGGEVYERHAPDTAVLDPAPTGV